MEGWPQFAGAKPAATRSCQSGRRLAHLPARKVRPGKCGWMVQSFAGPRGTTKFRQAREDIFLDGTRPHVGYYPAIVGDRVVVAMPFMSRLSAFHRRAVFNYDLTNNRCRSRQGAGDAGRSFPVAVVGDEYMPAGRQGSRSASVTERLRGEPPVWQFRAAASRSSRKPISSV